MGINEKLQEHLFSAQKSGDKLRLSTIRLLKTAVRYESDAKRRELDENEFIGLVARLIRERREAIELFKQGKREDLVQKEEAEIKILEEFLPPRLSQEELEKIIDEAIKEVDASSERDMGRVMKVIMPKVRGRVDAQDVKNIVLRRLAGSEHSG
jgi:uncharacterized protein YqeY